MPVINLTSKDEVEKVAKSGKAYNVIEVKGTKYGTEEEWSTPIFLNDHKMLAKLDEFGIGDVINMGFVKNGKFWDLNDITAPTKAELEDILEKIEKFGSGGGGNNNNKQTSGGPAKKSNWGGRTGEAHDRSAAIYLAFDFLKSTLADAKLKKLELSDLMDVADKLNLYIHDGLTPSDLGVEADEDPLDPPV